MVDYVTQFPSDTECTRYIATISDKVNALMCCVYACMFTHLVTIYFILLSLGLAEAANQCIFVTVGVNRCNLLVCYKQVPRDIICVQVTVALSCGRTRMHTHLALVDCYYMKTCFICLVFTA